MDFLDPRKKRTHKIQLMIGYALLAVAIGLGTLILVYGAYGYSLNTKTGGIIQNGLLFVDSQPSGADIYLNGASQHSTTSARLVLPAGNYTLKLSKDGYRDWQRKFELDEHSIARYVYPFLFPLKPIASALKTYSAQPGLITESPDRHWLLVQTLPAEKSAISFDEYDSGNLKSPSLPLNLPADLISSSDQTGTFKDVEWSTDNNHLLLERSYSGGSEFLIMDRQNPAKSINLNKLFKSSPTQVALRNKKTDQAYLYDRTAETLQLGNVSDGSLADPLLRHVLAFKAYGSNLIMYVTDSGMPAGQVQARIWISGKNYPLYTFTAGNQYLIDTAQFQGHSYFVAGSDTDARVNLYKDPLSDIQDPAIGKARPLITLREEAAAKLSFSSNARFVGVEAGQNFAVLDLETQQYYRYSLTAPLAGLMQWMDGHRLIGSSAGHVFVMDYDATNQQTLVASSWDKGGLFDRQYNHLFTTSSSTTDATKIDLLNVDMRAGADLPKSGQ